MYNTHNNNIAGVSAEAAETSIFRTASDVRTDNQNALDDAIIALYCGTYHKYNIGSLDGCWIDLGNYTDAEELFDDLALLHSDEEDPEFMFQDWSIELEGLSTRDLGECPSKKTLQMLIELCNADESDRDLACDYLALNNLSDFEDFDDLLAQAQDACVGYLNIQAWDPFIDWAEDFFRECYEIPEALDCYIDWERVARDLSYDYTESGSHVFAR